MHAGGRFFGATDDAFCVLGLVAVNANDEVGAIVEGERGLELKRLVDAPVEVLGGLAVPGVNGVALAGEPGGDFVLG